MGGPVRLAVVPHAAIQLVGRLLRTAAHDLGMEQADFEDLHDAAPVIRLSSSRPQSWENSQRL